jgi:3-oxoacyl-[acyl-carrier protein] reductase
MTPAPAADDVARSAPPAAPGGPRPSALVTGASRGIGQAITLHLARRGWALTLVARDADRLTEVRDEAASLGGDVQVVAADLAREGAVREVVSSHQAGYGSLNALVLAAGVGSAGPVAGYPMHRFDKQIAVNTRAPFEMIGTALPLLREGARSRPERGGRIIALASIEGLFPDAGLAAYAASKAALLSLVASVNLEEVDSGVTATAISPAFVATQMSEWATDRIPADSMIPVEDIVKVVDLVLSLSPAAVLPNVVLNRAGAGPYQA